MDASKILGAVLAAVIAASGAGGYVSFDHAKGSDAHTDILMQMLERSSERIQDLKETCG